uniref:Putative secreted protein n=1 Tax=Ixodes ricinus TaxID=34613 RepID=A0A6B0U250_IXORI
MNCLVMLAKAFRVGESALAQITRLLAVPALVRCVLAIQVHNMVVAQLRQLLEALPTLGTREVPFLAVDACMILELEGAKRSVATLVTPVQV